VPLEEPLSIVNSGTSSAAIIDFRIPTGNWVEDTHVSRTTINTTTGGTHNVLTVVGTIPDLVSLIALSGHMVRADGSSMPVNFFDGSNAFFSVYVNASRQLVERHGDASFNNRPCTIVVDYLAANSP